jgi:hypothetical protein
VIRAHLIARVIATAYSDPTEREHATQWLSWIALHMDTNRDLRWWDIPTWIARWHLRLTAGLTTVLGIGSAVGLRAGLAYGLTLGLTFGPAAGLTAGLAVELATGRRQIGTPQTLIVRLPKGRRELGAMLTEGLVYGLTLVLAVGLAVGLTYGLTYTDRVDQSTAILPNGLTYGLTHGMEYGLKAELTLGLPVGVVACVAAGLFRLWRMPIDGSSAATPKSSHHADRRAGLVVGLVYGLTFMLSVVVAAALVPGLPVQVLDGLTLALAAGVVLWAVSGPAPQVWFAQLTLSLRGRGRVRFIPLLEDALNRQVLRQAGAVYQFRHAELQDYLATQRRNP